MTELEEKEFNRKFDSWLDSEYDKYCEAEFDKYCQTLEQEKPKQLTQDVFNTLPNKFKCAAIDADGRAFAYLCKAKQLKINRYGQHKYKYGEHMYIGKGYDTTNWQNSAIDRE